jgi:hypothetical protein
MTGMASGTRLLATGFRLEGTRAGPASLGTDIVAGMLDSMALFADFAAVAEDSISDGRAEAAQAVRGMQLFATRARLVGEEEVDGRRAYLLRATGLSDIQIEQAKDGPVFVLDSTSLWLDVAELVPLRLSMAGQMTADRRTIPVTLEQQSFDYRAFGPLYEPQRQVMRITGRMEAMTTDPRQRRDMERVRRDIERMKSEMARMESELAKMPASQRRLIEGRMNQAMARFDQMTGEGVLEQWKYSGPCATGTTGRHSTGDSRPCHRGEAHGGRAASGRPDASHAGFRGDIPGAGQSGCFAPGSCDRARSTQRGHRR